MTGRIEPRLLKGFRDIDPTAMERRVYILNKIEKVFRLHSFAPLFTPTLEYLDILKGKMGEEADKLLFSFTDIGGREVGLRYEFTISLARYVAMNPNIRFPFKRYQIGSVFRAEKPQKGRFREFTQCDFDLVGSSSPIADAEIISVMYDVLNELCISEFKILMNDRRLLFSILEKLGVMKDMLLKASRLLDKIDRVGKEGVIKLLEEHKLLNESIKKFIEMSEPTTAYRDVMEEFSKMIDITKEVEEFTELMMTVNQMTDNDLRIVYSPALARGLDYYTGPVFEVVVEGVGLGSIAGGGRYDNMIGIFSGRDIPATGSSFGLDRLEEVLEKKNLFPSELGRPYCLVTIFGDETVKYSLDFYRQLHKEKIPAEIYLKPKNIGKQIGYADSRGFRYTVIIGPEEAGADKVKVKDMRTGEEKVLDKDGAIEFLKEGL